MICGAMNWDTCVAGAHGIRLNRPFPWIHDGACRKLNRLVIVHKIPASVRRGCFFAKLECHARSPSIQEKEAPLLERRHFLLCFTEEDFTDTKFNKEMEKDSTSLMCDPNVLNASSFTFNTEEEINTEDSESREWEHLTIQQAFQQMINVHATDDYQEECVSLLQKCKQHACVATAIHAYTHLCDNGLEVHTALGSYIVAMFVQSCSIPMAQQVFSRLLYRNQYSWTHLMQGHIEQGDPEHGLYLFAKMKEAGIRPSNFPYVLVLRACTALKCIRRGQQVHIEIVIALEEDLCVTRSLLDFYVKCGLLLEACDIYNDFQGQANVVDDDFMRLYKNHELVEDPTIFVHNMPARVVCSTALVHVFTLKACSSMKVLTRGHELHIQIAKEGFDQDYFVSNTLVDMYAKCGLLAEAWTILIRMPERDVVTWTALITGCIENGLCNDALKYLEMMRKDGVAPNSFTLVSCLKGCGIAQSLDSGRKLHAQIMKEGLYTDFVVCNSLVAMYSRCGSLEEAHDVFDKFARQNIISWTALIAGYTDHGLYNEAIDCFTNMVTAGVSPNIVAYICCLKACALTANVDMGRKLHSDLVKEEFETHNFTGNALMHMYARCGLCSDAKAVFDDLMGRDVISWTTMIAELAEDGQGEQALKMLEQMLDEGVCPNSHTYVCSLKVCGTIPAIDRGRMLHIEIIKRGLEKNPFITKALIHMYAECGKPINLG